MRTLTLFSTGRSSTAVSGVLHAKKRNGEKSDGTYSDCEFGGGFGYQGRLEMGSHTYSGLEQKPCGK